MEVLYQHAQKRRVQELKFEAVIHGADLKGGSGECQHQVVDNHGYNGDPESVRHLSEEQRQELTKRLMEEHSKAFKHGG